MSRWFEDFAKIHLRSQMVLLEFAEEDHSAGSDFIIKALEDKLTKFLNSPKLGLVTAVRLFEMFKDGKISKEEEAFVGKCLDDLVFGIIEGGMVSSTNEYMEADLSEQNIRISSEWLVHLKSLPTRSLEMKRQQHLLLVKGLHEIGHLLTPLFMEQLQMKKSTSTQVYVPPKRVGPVVQHKGKRTVVGDAEYGLEGILSGGRMFHERLVGIQ